MMSRGVQTSPQSRTLTFCSRSSWTALAVVTGWWAIEMTFGNDWQQVKALSFAKPLWVVLSFMWVTLAAIIIGAFKGGRWVYLSALMGVSLWTFYGFQFLFTTTSSLPTGLCAGYAAGSAVRFIETWRMEDGLKRRTGVGS